MCISFFFFFVVSSDAFFFFLFSFSFKHVWGQSIEHFGGAIEGVIKLEISFVSLYRFSWPPFAICLSVICEQCYSFIVPERRSIASMYLFRIPSQCVLSTASPTCISGHDRINPGLCKPFIRFSASLLVTLLNV